MEVVTIVPPEPGSLFLPPRLLTAGGSVWLSKAGTYRLFPFFPLSFRRDKQGYSVIVGNIGADDKGPVDIPEQIPHPAHKISGYPVFLNGQQIYGRHPLVDGDYLIYEINPDTPIRFVFQEDPALNNHKRGLIDIQLSYRLKKAVMMDSAGIRFRPGKQPVSWSSVQGIIVRQPSPNEFVVKLVIAKEFNLQKTIVQAIPFTLSADEFHNLGLWLYNVAPCLPSILNSPLPIPDAYITVAKEKVVAPMKKGSRQLPYTEDEILSVSELPPMTGRVKAVFSRTLFITMALHFAFLVISAINLSTALQNKELINSVIWMVGGVLAVCIIILQFIKVGQYILQR